MASAASPYLPSDTAARLRHGEVLASVRERRVSVGQDPDGGGELFDVEEVTHPFAVVITQDCDLEQDVGARAIVVTAQMKEEDRKKLLRSKENGTLHNVLLVEAYDASTKEKGVGGSDIWKRVVQNKDERYQYLAPNHEQNDLSGQPIPALLLDFKRVFSCPIGQLHEDIQRGRTFRRARLIPPFGEHLAVRAGHFLQRVALPENHHEHKPGPPPALAAPTRPALPEPEDPPSGGGNER